MKILVTKFKSIGDVLLITPLLENLFISFEGAQIDLVLKEGTSGLVSELPFINKIYQITPKKGLHGFIEALSFFFEIRKNCYDIFIGTDRGERTAIFSLISGAKTRIGRNVEHLNPLYKKSFQHFFLFHGDRHIVDLNLDPIRILNKKIVSKRISINDPTRYYSSVKKLIPNEEDFIHVHPVSQCAYKSVSNSLMAKIIDFCQFDLKTKVVITGSKSKEDIDQVDKILNLCNSNPVNLCGKTSISEVSAINKLSRLLIVVDTAVMHVSSANQIPVIAFFGPTAANNWGPVDSKNETCSYERIGGVQYCGIHTVIATNKNCVPCSNAGCNNSGKSDCLSDLNYDLVRKEIVHTLKNEVY